MNTVSILRDDMGIQQLRTGSAVPVMAPAVVGLAPYSAVGSEARQVSIQARSQHERRRMGRRHEERRLHVGNVLLNTRSQHERRTRQRRTEDTLRSSEGVDLYI